MSSYANASTDFPIFGLPGGAIASIPSQNVQAALDRASNFADGFLAAQYALPLLSYTTELTEAVCKIAAYELLSVRGYNPEGDGGNLRSRRNDAIQWLRDIAKGTISPPGIVGADGVNEAQDGAGDVTSEPLRGFQTDPPNNAFNRPSGGGGWWDD